MAGLEKLYPKIDTLSITDPGEIIEDIVAAQLSDPHTMTSELALFYFGGKEADPISTKFLHRFMASKALWAAGNFADDEANPFSQELVATEIYEYFPKEVETLDPHSLSNAIKLCTEAIKAQYAIVVARRAVAAASEENATIATHENYRNRPGYRDFGLRRYRRGEGQGDNGDGGSHYHARAYAARGTTGGNF